MKYEYNTRPNTSFSETALEVLQRLPTLEYAVLIGRNNSGKSFVLKEITQRIGQSASYIGPARYQNFNLLGNYTPNPNRKDERWREFVQHMRHQQMNIDNSPLNLQQAIAELSDTKRQFLVEIIDLLLGSRMAIEYTIADNSMSQKYISCDGHNISYTSSGYRLICTILTCLLDENYDTYLIDEPELGISPEAQGCVGGFPIRQDTAR